jgi:hypothetical protein
VGKLGFKSYIFLLFRGCLSVYASLEVIQGCFYYEFGDVMGVGRTLALDDVLL